MRRRTFLQNTALAGSLSILKHQLDPYLIYPGKKLDRIGIQLYSLIGLLNEDFKGTIAKLADLGYKELEFAGPYEFSADSVKEGSILKRMFGFDKSGYYQYSPTDLRKLLDDHGLTAPSIHVAIDTLREKFDEVVEAAHVVGHEYLTIPMLRYATLDEWKSVAHEMSSLGRKCQQE